MKCFLMSAGKGERLGQITNKTPKCLIDLGNGFTTMKFWLKVMERAHIRDILINTHHLPDEIIKYIGKQRLDGIRITYTQEEKLLGSAGTLYANKDYIKGEYVFIVAYSDTWIKDFDLRRMINYHKKHGELMTVGLYREKHGGQMVGIAEIKDGRMVSFAEKQKESKGEFAWAGIFIAHPSVVMNHTDIFMRDIASDLLPKLTKPPSRVRAFIINSEVYDIGTPEKLERARGAVRGIGFGALEKEGE